MAFQSLGEDPTSKPNGNGLLPQLTVPQVEHFIYTDLFIVSVLAGVTVAVISKYFIGR